VIFLNHARDEPEQNKNQKPERKSKMNPQIEINPEQKINDPVMADCGTEYFSTFQYRVDGDVELYGAEEWRTGKIIWNTTDAWKAEDQRVQSELRETPDAPVYSGLLDDQSNACDWDEFEIQDENGDIMPEAAAKEVAALLP